MADMGVPSGSVHNVPYSVSYEDEPAGVIAHIGASGGANDSTDGSARAVHSWVNPAKVRFLRASVSGRVYVRLSVC